MDKQSSLELLESKRFKITPQEFITRIKTKNTSRKLSLSNYQVV